MILGVFRWGKSSRRINYINYINYIIDLGGTAFEDINGFLWDANGADNPEMVDLAAGAPVIDRLRAHLQSERCLFNSNTPNDTPNRLSV